MSFSQSIRANPAKNNESPLHLHMHTRIITLQAVCYSANTEFLLPFVPWRYIRQEVGHCRCHVPTQSGAWYSTHVFGCGLRININMLTLVAVWPLQDRINRILHVGWILHWNIYYADDLSATDFKCYILQTQLSDNHFY